MVDTDGGVEETRMEAFVLTEIDAVEHVVVAGVGRQYLACLLTLKTDASSSNLAESALRFVRGTGSPATTVEEARKCNHFKTALLKGFANCNKLVYESCKRQGLQEKPAQLRRYTILSDKWTTEDGTLRPDGKVHRAEVLSRYAQVIESMYGAVMTNTTEAARVSSMAQVAHTHHVSVVASAASSVGERGWHSLVQDPLAAPSALPQATYTAAAIPDSEVGRSDVTVASAERESELAQTAASHSPPPEINIPPASSDIVSDRAAAPSALSKLWSAARSALCRCQCLGPHSQVLDDDILNPGHTVAKRRAAPGTQKPKKPPPPADLKPADNDQAPHTPAPQTVPSPAAPSPQDYPATPGGLYMSHLAQPYAQPNPSFFMTGQGASEYDVAQPPAPQGVYV